EGEAEGEDQQKRVGWHGKTPRAAGAGDPRPTGSPSSAPVAAPRRAGPRTTPAHGGRCRPACARRPASTSGRPSWAKARSPASKSPAGPPHAAVQRSPRLEKAGRGGDVGLEMLIGRHGSFPPDQLGSDDSRRGGLA